MNAFDQLVSYYQANDSLDKLAEDLEIHAQQGIAHLSPEFCILARPVDSRAPEHLIIDIQSNYLTLQCNCWHIHIAAGDLSKCLAVMPYPLEFVSFQRGGDKLKVYNLKSITRHGILKTKNTEDTSTSSPS